MSTIRQRTEDEILSTAGRVAVLMGGSSAEREISLDSGRAITASLLRVGVDARELVWNDDLVSLLAECSPDRVFIALHGRGGEDGTVQGLLEILKIPYTGSDLFGCALSMDKVRSKQIWQSVGLATPAFSVFRRGDSAKAFPHDLSFPVMVKPAREGSSLGATKVCESSELGAAIEGSLAYDDTVLVESWVSGGEYTLSIVANDPLPIIKLETPHEFYDYDAKYVVDTTRYICPCGLSDDLVGRCIDLSVNAFDALGASGWGRVDFMLDQQDEPWLIELNTVPGMTDHSLVPMAAAAAGMNFDELVVKILGTSFGGVE
jgi:D-alanine-D-alanine ligase